MHSALLLVGMAAVLAACGWIIAGGEGLFWAIAAAIVSLLFSPRISPQLILRLYQGRRLHPAEIPALFSLVSELSRRGDLARAPDLYYLPSPVMNAFTVGSANEYAIALTDGLLRGLTLRELAGVLAHEVSHIRNNDIWLMTLADTIGRLTSTMTMFGLLLLLINLPLLLMNTAQIPWLLIAVLVVAPSLGSLLQLALSRSREFDADMEAVKLTADPAGLAAALQRLDHYHLRSWPSLFLPGRRRDPSLLRTHPDTSARIARLLALQVPQADGQSSPSRLVLPEAFVPPVRRSRWRLG